MAEASPARPVELRDDCKAFGALPLAVPELVRIPSEAPALGAPDPFRLELEELWELADLEDPTEAGAALVERDALTGPVTRVWVET